MSCQLVHTISANPSKIPFTNKKKLTLNQTILYKLLHVLECLLRTGYIDSLLIVMTPNTGFKQELFHQSQIKLLRLLYDGAA